MGTLASQALCDANTKRINKGYDKLNRYVLKSFNKHLKNVSKGKQTIGLARICDETTFDIDWFKLSSTHECNILLNFLQSKIGSYGYTITNIKWRRWNYVIMQDHIEISYDYKCIAPQ